MNPLGWFYLNALNARFVQLNIAKLNESPLDSTTPCGLAVLVTCLIHVCAGFPNMAKGQCFRLLDLIDIVQSIKLGKVSSMEIVNPLIKSTLIYENLY